MFSREAAVRGEHACSVDRDVWERERVQFRDLSSNMVFKIMNVTQGLHIDKAEKVPQT